MRNIRGTAAYWQNAGSDVFAMLRSLCPPTWFVTLLANKAGWDDLQLVLHGKARLPLDEQADFLASLTRAARRKAARDDPVSSFEYHCKVLYVEFELQGSALLH
jgi:hypothetical protein